MARKRILFICGSLNQTTQMHSIARHLPDHDCFFTPYYCDGVWRIPKKMGLLDFTIIGGQNRATTEKYFREHDLPVDYAGQKNKYDLMLTCTDLMVQKNTRTQPLILVQEGMTDPENMAFKVVKQARKYRLPFPIWIASTSTTGLSHAYAKFCVASEGYKKHFANKGIDPQKLVVTGIPNFDNAREYLKNDFPHKGYVLVATTDMRENFKFHNRVKFLKNCAAIAAGKQLIFRLHPNENKERSTREINLYAPGALVYTSGNTNHMVANCDTLITQYSSVVYIGLALGKTVYSYFDVESLKEMLPIQNGGTSGKNISNVCREYLQ